MIRVLIADDHHLVRQGIRALLEKYPDIEVVGEAQNGHEALAFATQLKPEVLILDINMPEMNGIDVVSDLTAAAIPTSIVILSMYSDESLVKRAFQNGAKGYLLKKSIAQDLISAVRAASQKELYLSPELGEVIDIDEWLTSSKAFDIVDPVDQLSPREREVCQLVAQGLTNQAIAKKLNISIKTVEKHRSNMMSKLGVQDVASLIREVIRTGIVFVDK